MSFRKLIQLSLLVCWYCSSYAQEGSKKCNCPPIKLYVYDTKIDFQADNSNDAAEAGKYVEAQQSGDWLDGAYTKQQSDEFKVYKNIRPGANQGTTYEQSPADGGSSMGGVDFTSAAEISRSGTNGNYIYTVTVRIFDAYTQNLVTSITKTTTDLGKVDDLIDESIGSFSPVKDRLRDYQKKIRDASGNSKWIGLKWKATAESTHLKIGEKTTIHIRVFDCLDDKPAPGQNIRITMSAPQVCLTSAAHVTTDAGGEATLVLTGKSNGETEVIPDFTYTAINGKSGYHGLRCDDPEKITVGGGAYKLKMTVEITGPEGLHYKLDGEASCKLTAYADGTCALVSADGTKNMHVKVSAAGVPGKMWLVSPMEYDIPFVVNIGNLSASGKAPAKLSIENFSPSKMGRNTDENYQTPAGVYSFPGNISHTIGGVFYDITINSAKETGKQAMEDLPWANRLKAHKGDKTYFQTAQGRSDLLEMQKWMQAHGRGDLFNHMQSPSGKPSGYDQAFVNGMKGTQNNASAYGNPPDQNSPTVMGGVLHFDATFDSSSTMVLNIFQENSPGGDLHGTINIKAEKLK